jgi:hypothetical protein
MRDKRAFSAVQKYMKAAGEELDAHWIYVFSPFGYESVFLTTLRHVVQAAMRGLAIRRLYNPVPTTWEPERQVLEAMITRYLANAKS